MKTSEAKKPDLGMMIRNLQRKKGRTAADIAKILRERGFQNNVGKPISEKDVQNRIYATVKRRTRSSRVIEVPESKPKRMVVFVGSPDEVSEAIRGIL